MTERRSPEQTINLGGRIVTYTVRRSQRAKYLGLRVTPTHGLEVVVPLRGRMPEIAALLHERSSWILRALDKVASSRPAPATPLGTGTNLPYRGIDHRLIVREHAGRPAIVRHEGMHTIEVLRPGQDTPLIALLTGWYREEARAILTAEVCHWATALGVTYARLTIRDSRSRWGSCSSRGGLNFSWRLVLAPPAVLEYVVIHELAHRRELNHSPRFWAIVAAHCPDYRLQQRWLREHGARLMAVLSIAP
jgi:predicted metal-dependent hydrolase